MLYLGFFYKKKNLKGETKFFFGTIAMLVELLSKVTKTEEKTKKIEKNGDKNWNK